MPLVRSQGRDLWEVRSSLTGGKIARVVFCVDENRMIFAAQVHQEEPEDAAERDRFGAQTQEGRRVMKKKNIGSSFDSWLREEGVHEEVTAVAIKRVLARQVEAAMSDCGLSKAAMARRMKTSRSQLHRLLDPENDSVTLTTLQKAARAVEREVQLELV